MPYTWVNIRDVLVQTWHQRKYLSHCFAAPVVIATSPVTLECAKLIQTWSSVSTLPLLDTRPRDVFSNWRRPWGYQNVGITACRFLFSACCSAYLLSPPANVNWSNVLVFSWSFPYQYYCKQNGLMVGGENWGQCSMEKQNCLKKMWSGINPWTVCWPLWAVRYSTERVPSGKALTVSEETFFGCNLWRWFGTTVLLHGLSFVMFVSACNLASVRRIFSSSTSREISCLPP